MGLLWWVLGAALVYSLVVYMSSMAMSPSARKEKEAAKEKKKKVEIEESFTEDDNIPTLVTKLLSAVENLQVVANNLKGKLVPSDSSSGFKKADKFMNAPRRRKEEDDEKEDFVAPVQPHKSEGDSDSEDDVPAKKPMEQFLEARSYTHPSRSASRGSRHEGFAEEKRKKKGGCSYKGMESSFSFNSQPLDDE